MVLPEEETRSEVQRLKAALDDLRVLGQAWLDDEASDAVKRACAEEIRTVLAVHFYAEGS